MRKKDVFSMSADELKSEFKSKIDIQNEKDEKLIETIKNNYNINDVSDSTITASQRYIFAKRLRIICNDLKIKGVDFENVFDIPQETMNRFLNGTRFPSDNMIIRIAKALYISPRYLLGLTDFSSFTAEEVNKAIGLNENAIRNLYMLHHDTEEMRELSDSIPPSDKYASLLSIFSDFIGDFSNFNSFLTYIKRYVDIKKKIDLIEDDLQKELLKDKLEKVVIILNKNIIKILDKIAEDKEKK